jgi:hypothetical protein
MFRKDYPLNFYKFIADYLKHLTTLSTGSIVVIATFYEKVFSCAQHNFLAIISLIAFVICIVFTTVIYTILIYFESPRHDRKTPKWAKCIAAVCLFIVLIAFLTGIVSFTVFGVLNLAS